MKNDKIDKLVKAVTDVRSAVDTTIKTSKQAIDESARVASKVLNKHTVSSGVNATSKGVENMAKAAKLAGRGADFIASALDRASKQIKKIGTKISRKS